MSYGSPTSPEQAYIADLTAECDNLWAQLIKAKERIVRLEKEAYTSSWATNPDRSGGAFTQDEIDRANSW